MNITDVPQSGIYLQLGAITQLVVQLIDGTSGLPIPLQAATNLVISILYPDGTTARDLPAELYTDGADGMIVYTTANDNASNIDLTQVGLYAIQGLATVGGVPLPPSAESDFYVLPNVDNAGQPPLAYTSSALILYDPNNVRWAITVDTGGVLHYTARLTGPVNSLTLNKLVLKDSDGIYWTVTMKIDETYQAVQGGTFDESLANLILLDSSTHAWIVTISTLGVLQTA